MPAYAPFTPNDSGQRLHPPYYRGCWHGVSRCFFCRLRQDRSGISRRLFFSTESALQPAGLLHTRGIAGSGFPHCPIFPTAASRRSLGRVSVPVWLIVLSDQLRIVALVSFYLTNKLIRLRLIQ